jgi:hypothetical protein
MCDFFGPARASMLFRMQRWRNDAGREQFSMTAIGYRREPTAGRPLQQHNAAMRALVSNETLDILEAA